MGTEGRIIIPTPSLEEIKPTIPYMKNLIRVSDIIGMWPESKKSKPFFYHLRVWLVFSYCVSMVASFSIQIIENFEHLDSIAILVDFTTVFISGTFRYIYIYIRGNKYLLLVSLMHNSFLEYSHFPKEKRESLLKSYRFANKVVLVYITFIVFWVLQICTGPIITYIWKISKSPSGLNETLLEPIEYPVLLKTYAPFDYYTQPNNILFYAYQLCGYIIFCWIYVIVDSFWYMVIFLTIGQFLILKDSVNTISETLSKDEWTNLETLQGTELQSVREGLKHCIRHHQFSRAYVRLVEDLTNPIVLADVIHVLISVAFMLLDIIVAMNIGDWNKAVYAMEYFITAVFHMFFFDWLGNELALQEEEVAKAIHLIPWYKCPTEKSLLQIMSLQARRPYKLTGGRMFTLSLEFYIKTMRGVFSLFTFLLTMTDR